MRPCDLLMWLDVNLSDVVRKSSLDVRGSSARAGIRVHGVHLVGSRLASAGGLSHPSQLALKPCRNHIASGE